VDLDQWISTSGSRPVDLDIKAIAERARDFRQTLRTAQQRIGNAGFVWYPYDTLAALDHLDKLLTGGNRFLLSPQELRTTGDRFLPAPSDRRVLDLGCGDGELAFFLETLGYQVVAVDHPLYNHNGMRGVRALKAALGSAIEIHEIDLDRPFTLPHDTYHLVLFLGILYHLRNPFYVLEELARRAGQCLLSTRVARRFPNGAAMPAGMSLAYLVGEDELNDDNSNYFIFSEAGLRVMLQRAHWEVRQYISLGDTVHSDPVRPDRDERAFCLLRSRHNRLANLELLEGWHESEETGWRWTRREFAVQIRGLGALTTNRTALAMKGRALTMKIYVPEESLQRLGPLTLSSSASGRELEPATYETPGLHTLVRHLDAAGGAELLLRFRLSGALPPDQDDDRERGIIVGSIEVE
jgi:tRNA (mo5U34)-methyltransferase